MSVVDKDRPSTWKPYRKGLCDNCTAACCTMPVEIHLSDLLRLELISEDEVRASPRKIFNRLSKQGLIKSYRASTGLFMLQQKSNDDCVFLGEDRLCTVYDKRPDVCRTFPQVGPRIGFCPAQKKFN